MKAQFATDPTLMPSFESERRYLRASAVIPATLAFEGVSRHFGEISAVDDVSFTAREGEVICLLGPSGCGKSTLLRLAAGIDTPDGGRILLDGREMAGPAVFVEPEHRGIGLVFQDYALFPHLDALGNVMFGIANLGRQEASRVADAALRRVGLGHRLRSMPHELSGGEQQRVALARAIVPRPRVLLMDEPFSNLDRRMRDAVREDTVALLRETGATALVVTHDPEEAMRIADRIALMRDGRLVQIAPGRDIYNRPIDIEAARFFCDLNEVDGMIANGTITSPIGTYPAEGLPDGKGILAIRQQSARIVPVADARLVGRVLARRFLGESVLGEIGVNELEMPFRIRCSLPLNAEVGHNVGIEIRSSEVLVFAAKGP